MLKKFEIIVDVEARISLVLLILLKLLLQVLGALQNLLDVLALIHILKQPKIVLLHRGIERNYSVVVP